MLLASKSCLPYALEYDVEGAVVGVGGGSIIDQAKIIATARGERCIAVPTTASGAACTSHAVVWGVDKYNVQTVLPKVILPTFPVKLEGDVLEATLWDCYCHIIESEWSDLATNMSKIYCTLAKGKLELYLRSGNILSLIEAGNLAGKAIDITGTNIIHQLSYPLTLKYGIPHGLALKMVVNASKVQNNSPG